MTNYLYNQSPKDGTEIGETQNGAVFEKLFQTISPGGKTAHFDAVKFGWIGSADQTVFVTVTWHKSAVKTFADARIKAATMGASGPGTDNYLLAALSNKIFGTKYKIVSGYGSGECRRSCDRERRGGWNRGQGLDHAHRDLSRLDP